MIEVERVRELLRRAILTLMVVPDPDAAYRAGPHSAWPQYRQDAQDAYASAPERVQEFVPTQHDLSVFLQIMSWLAWYQRQSVWAAASVRIYIALVCGKPMWMLQQLVRRQHGDHKLAALRARLWDMEIGIGRRFADEIAAMLAVSTVQPWFNDDGSDLDEMPVSPRFHRALDAVPHDDGSVRTVIIPRKQRQWRRKRKWRGGHGKLQKQGR